MFLSDENKLTFDPHLFLCISENVKSNLSCVKSTTIKSNRDLRYITVIWVMILFICKVAHINWVKNTLKVHSYFLSSFNELFLYLSYLCDSVYSSQNHSDTFSKTPIFLQFTRHLALFLKKMNALELMVFIRSLTSSLTFVCSLQAAIMPRKAQNCKQIWNEYVLSCMKIFDDDDFQFLLYLIITVSFALKIKLKPSCDTQGMNA